MGMHFDAATGKYVFENDPGVTDDINQEVQTRMAAANSKLQSQSPQRDYSPGTPLGTYSLQSQPVSKPSSTGSAVTNAPTPSLAAASTGLSSAIGGGAGAAGPTPTAGGTSLDPSPTSAMAGLTGAGGSMAMGQDALTGQGQPMEAGGSNLRQGLGTRLYPQESYVVAGLRKAY